MMNWDLETLLAIAVFITGAIWLLDYLFFAKRRQLLQGMTAAEPKWVEYAHSFFPVLLAVFLLRSFIVEPFRIPTGSLEPSLLIGDFVLTNKFTYGIRLPIAHTKIMPMNEPQRGDIVVFRWPLDPKIDYIKRIVGLPGDHILYQDKVLTINGQLAPQVLQDLAIDNPSGSQLGVENLSGVKHAIYVKPDVPAQDFEVTVPPGSYFAMGDNRDSSSDSRYWGFVPEENLVGKAFLIWMSWDKDRHAVRWPRLGMRIRSLS